MGVAAEEAEGGGHVELSKSRRDRRSAWRAVRGGGGAAAAARQLSSRSRVACRHAHMFASIDSRNFSRHSESMSPLLRSISSTICSPSAPK